MGKREVYPKSIFFNEFLVGGFIFLRFPKGKLHFHSISLFSISLFFFCFLFFSPFFFFCLKTCVSFHNDFVWKKVFPMIFLLSCALFFLFGTNNNQKKKKKKRKENKKNFFSEKVFSEKKQENLFY